MRQHLGIVICILNVLKWENVNALYAIIFFGIDMQETICFNTVLLFGNIKSYLIICNLKHSSTSGPVCRYNLKCRS